MSGVVRHHCTARHGAWMKASMESLVSNNAGESKLSKSDQYYQLLVGQGDRCPLVGSKLLVNQQQEPATSMCF